MSKVFWLGVIGLIFGILGAVFAIMVQGIGEAFGATGGTNLYYNAAGAIVFSVIGMVGAALETRRIVSGLLMIIGGIGVLISISALGIITVILYVLGGILILARRKKEEPLMTPPTMTPTQATTPPSEPPVGSHEVQK
ncbi:MAG: hypothetical protein ACXV7G_10855 [Halobacteriota archaeon]